LIANKLSLQDDLKRHSAAPPRLGHSTFLIFQHEELGEEWFKVSQQQQKIIMMRRRQNSPAKLGSSV
jgi:hypothetical protein